MNTASIEVESISGSETAPNATFVSRSDSSLLRTLGTTLEQHKKQNGSDTEPNLCVVLNAKAIKALSQALDQTCERFDARTMALEEQVAARTAGLVSLSHRLELIIDSISDGIITYDVLGHIESCNRASREIFQLGNNDMKGKKIQSIFGSAFDTSVVLSNPVEIDLSIASGDVSRLELEVQPIANSENHARMMRIRDLTDVKKSEKRLSEQAFLIDNVQAMVMMSSELKGVEWCNPHMENVTGYSKSELVGTDATKLIIQEKTPKASWETLKLAFQERTHYNVELVIRHKSGRPIWVQLEGHPIFTGDGALDKFVSMGVDITERKKQEQMQYDFCSMVSHELRTPLTVVSGSLDAMSAGLTGQLSEAANELVEMGRRNCGQLSVLIEDILDINKLESGVVGFESEFVSLREPLCESLASTIPLLNDSGLTLRNAIEPVHDMVFGDPQRLRQVFTNLLSNAIKFSRPGSEVTVGLQARSGGVRAYVKDQGIGIPLDFQEHIFKKFSRDVQVQASGKEGFGLGLCISKGLIEQMGGYIGYETVPNEGTTFYIDMECTAVGSFGRPAPVAEQQRDQSAPRMALEVATQQND